MEITRLFDYIYHQQSTFPLDRAFNAVLGEEIIHFSTDRIIDEAEKLASGLLDLGIEKGDKISLVSYLNRPEWIVIDIACLMIGAVTVPLYPTISSDDYVYILNESESKIIFIGGGDLYKKVKTAQADTPTLKSIYAMDNDNEVATYLEISNDKNLTKVKEIAKTIHTDDLATIIYTSGTTGKPKGVMLSHKNIITAVRDTLETFPLARGGRVLSFLPYCHIFERACIYGYTDACVEVYCTGTDNLGGEEGDLRRIKPMFFTTVPRLLEKVYEKIYNKGLELTGMKKKLFFWALSLTDDFEFNKSYSGIRALEQKIADKLIFSKWREALGGEIKGIVTGAAPCPRKIAQVFSAAGIPIMEGYGLTETSPTLAINRFTGECMLGSVGVNIKSTDLLIDDSDGSYLKGEGEILAKGDNIMKGYYKKPEATAEVFKEIDGHRYFKTGDIGKFVKGSDNKDYLVITDRKKELLKTSGGKYVAPAPIENKLRENFLVEQVMVVGDKQKFVSALIVPASTALEDWARHKGLNSDDYEAFLKTEEVMNKYQSIIDGINPNFSHIEQIKKFKLLPNEWEATKTDGSTAELTPTMKLKRRVILEKFASEIEKIYT